jgi:hypothetical protein
VKPRTLTWALGALALALTVALAVSLWHRQPATDTAQPAPPSSQAQTTAGPTVPAAEPAAQNGPAVLPSSEVEAHDASPGATPYSQTDEARRLWGPVATGFGKAFTATHGKNAAQWRNSLVPFVTGTVEDQLSSVDLANVPNGSFDSIEPAEYGDDKVAVFVHYDTDLTLVTYLILDGTSWRIYAYDRWDE